MRSDGSDYELWDRVPTRYVLAVLAVSTACAAVGLFVPPFMTLGGVVFGVFAFGLILYGLLGSLAGPFEEGWWHGVACILFPPFYPLYYQFTRPDQGWGPFFNMVLGFGLLWVGVRTFPMYAEVGPGAPARAAVKGERPATLEEQLDAIGPARGAPPGPGVGSVITTTDALGALLAKVHDEPSARKAAPWFRQLVGQLQRDYEAAGVRSAVSDDGQSRSISAYVKFGPEFREVERRYNDQRKRIRKIPGLFEVLTGAR